MIPAAFDYIRAGSADDAFMHLQRLGGDARVLAGGQSLIPAMRFRLARPAVLVDINGVNELDAIRLDGSVLTLGAITRDSAVERAPWINDRKWSLFHDVSRVVADPVVRQMGTVVGSLCHNDPAGDWTAVALAARAEMVIRGKGGLRTVPIDTFLVDSFTTAVEEGEMAMAVRFPVPDDRTAGSYQKVERKVGDYATAAAAVVLTLKAGGEVGSVSIGLTNVGETALLAEEAARLLVGSTLGPETVKKAVAAAEAITAPASDRRGTPQYRTKMAGVMMSRALARAAQRVRGE